MNWLLGIAIASLCCFIIQTYGQQQKDNADADQAPEDCNLNPSEALDSYSTVEDFERCAPYLLPRRTRLYYMSGAGNQVTLRENRGSLKRFRILPKILVDVSKVDMTTTVMGKRISMPIAASPSAYQKLASEWGEIDTVRAVTKAGTIMTLSSLSTTLIEDVAAAAMQGAILWMQIYFFTDLSITANIVRRAEAYGFQAWAVTVDTPIFGPLPVNAMAVLQGNPRNLSAVNVGSNFRVDPSLTCESLLWLKRNSRLPIVAKGVLTVEGAIRAARCGASAILVSNHGARQLDYVPATIDVLPMIVAALKNRFPPVEVYVDGGFRTGIDVFKALALGARVVFVGRPILWGLTAGGERGVTKVLNILRSELNQTMILAETPRVASINRNMILEHKTCETSFSGTPPLLYEEK